MLADVAQLRVLARRGNAAADALAREEMSQRVFVQRRARLAARP